MIMRLDVVRNLSIMEVDHLVDNNWSEKMKSGLWGARGGVVIYFVAMTGLTCSSPVDERPAPDVVGQGLIQDPAEEPGDPCHGTELVLAEAREHCRVDDEQMRPPAAGLAITVDPLRFVSGEPSTAVLRLRNATDEPMEVRMEPTAEFSTSLYRDGRPIEGEQTSGAPPKVEDARNIQVVIEAGGALSAEIDVPTGVSGGGIYQLRIGLPWRDEQGAAFVPFEAEVDVEITP